MNHATFRTKLSVTMSVISLKPDSVKTMHLLKANAMRSNTVKGNGSFRIRRLSESWVEGY